MDWLATTILNYIRNYYFVVALLLSFTSYFVLRRRSRKLPPGPTGIPFLGYLPFLGKDTHLELLKLSEKYGDVFGLYLGRDYAVVVKDYVILKDLFKQLAACDRPKDLFKILPGGGGFAEMNGPKWIEQRRYTIQKMKHLGFGVSKWEKSLQEEVHSFVDSLRGFNGKPTNIHRLLAASISNNVMSLVTGYRLPMGHPARDIVDWGVEASQSSFDQAGLITIFPKLYEIAVHLGFIRVKEKMEAMKEMNKYVKDTIEDQGRSEENSFIREYQEEIKNNEQLNTESSFNVPNLVGNVQALIIAGSDTTKLSLQWLFLAMASYPDIQNKIHTELDATLGRDELINWQDRHRLPYCHAAILEGQRWRSVVPLNLLHKAQTDLVAGEYDIPKGSNIIGFIWGIHMEPRYWDNPDTFRPERFLDQNGAVRKNIENYVPFSVGKRNCIGETVAMVEMFLYFVTVMQNFKILPQDMMEPPQLKGHLGLTFHPPEGKLRYVAR